MRGGNKPDCPMEDRVHRHQGQNDLGMFQNQKVQNGKSQANKEKGGKREQMPSYKGDYRPQEGVCV